MKLKKLKLKNFRNYKELLIDFYDGINIFYGENAQGKTNILESIYMFSSSKSHRGTKDKDLIKFNEDFCETEIEFISQRREQKAKYEISSTKNKKLYINDIESKKYKALFGIFNTVIFSPEDLGLIKNSPEDRRKFMDTDISQIKPEYFKLLKDYKKIIFLKNNILKENNINSELIDVYNEKIASYASKITIHRMRFIKRIDELCSLALSYISDKKEEVKISYIPGIDEELTENTREIKEAYLLKLSKIKEEEILKKVSLIGPHRDDIRFDINGVDAKYFASQGQQRSIILSLKLAEFEFMKEVLMEPPLLLLDDILSELDINRQNKLLKFIRDNQTILTCTDKDLYKNIKYPYKMFLVKNGEIALDKR